MRRSDKQVLIICNELSYDNNTLTNFTGTIPSEFLNENKSWKVSVRGCGFHFMLKQPIASKHENHPSLIQVTFGDLKKAFTKRGSTDLTKLDLWMFENSLKLFVDREKSYTQRSLVEDFQHQTAIHEKHTGKLDGVPFKYNPELEAISFGQFEKDGKDSNERISKAPKDQRRAMKTFVFINARFIAGLNIPLLSNLQPTEINDEPYYHFFNSRKWNGPICTSIERDFPLKEPEIIQITSPDIEHNINNGIFDRSLCHFTVKRSGIKEWVNKEFKNHQFSDVLNNRITKFTIKFVDEKLDELHLTRGLPSWVLLTFSPEMDDERNVIISSGPNDLHPENDVSKFSVELKQTMDFSMAGDPKVALTRLSFKNKWKIMPRLKLNIAIFDCETGLVGNCNFENFDCPRGSPFLRNCDDIIQWCKRILKQKISVKMEKSSNGYLSMNFPNKKYIIILGSDLVQCLGLNYLHRKSGDLFTDLKKHNGGSREENAERDISILVKSAMARYIMARYKTVTSDLPFESTGDIAIFCDDKLSLDIILPPRKIQLYPNELYIYSNIVEHWPVMGQYRKLLKIVALKQDDHDENVTMDFHRPEYHSLSELHPRILQFQICTVEDAPIEPFNKNDRMYVTMQFSYN